MGWDSLGRGSALAFLRTLQYLEYPKEKSRLPPLPIRILILDVVNPHFHNTHRYFRIMHILVVNDDGPPSNQSSPYVHAFIVALQGAGHLTSVVLPHEQRSWIGKAHFVGQITKPTYFRPGNLHQDDGTTHQRPSTSKENAEEWVLVNGTPATCTQLGLHHFFQDRPPVDLVVSGPNYGRNSTSLFSLSSGTIGGAMEAAVCQKKAIALSFAFWSRDHDPELIAESCRHSVRLVEHRTFLPHPQYHNDMTRIISYCFHRSHDPLAAKKCSG